MGDCLDVAGLEGSAGIRSMVGTYGNPYAAVFLSHTSCNTRFPPTDKGYQVQAFKVNKGSVSAVSIKVGVVLIALVFYIEISKHERLVAFHCFSGKAQVRACRHPRKRVVFSFQRKHGFCRSNVGLNNRGPLVSRLLLDLNPVSYAGSYDTRPAKGTNILIDRCWVGSRLNDPDRYGIAERVTPTRKHQVQKLYGICLS